MRVWMMVFSQQVAVAVNASYIQILKKVPVLLIKAFTMQFKNIREGRHFNEGPTIYYQCTKKYDFFVFVVISHVKNPDKTKTKIYYY
jgi:hypothetical protein